MAALTEELEHMDWEEGKKLVENTRPVKLPSSTAWAGHCSAPLLSDRHREVGKGTLQIQKWRVEIKACNCRDFFLQRLSPASKRPLQPLKVAAPSGVQM